MPKVSIIVPVYKVEKFIRECLDSILAQTFMDWECLLIDDGSPDESGEICDAYAAKDPRIRVFHKANGGVSSARNLGLDNAKGEWVTFVDADDFLSPTFIEGLIKPTLQHSDLDLVHGGCTNWKEGKTAGINQLYEDYIGTQPDLVFEKFRGLTFSKLFRLENVNHWSDGLPLRFDEQMMIAEDMAFTLDYLLTVKKFSFVSEIGYFYRIDNYNSATKKRVARNLENELHCLNHIYNGVSTYVSANNIQIVQSIRYQQLTLRLYGIIECIYSSKKKKDEQLALLNNLHNKYSSIIDLSKLSKKQTLIMILFLKRKYTLLNLVSWFI